MTLLEIERLTRKISTLPSQGGSSDIANKLAGDFAAACRGANHRLQQCEAMIRAGERHQAIQLAETAPSLLDLVTLLEFGQADEWRRFCGKAGLPVAERIEGRCVQILNECYAEGIATDHPLYAAYRKAVLTRNDEAALVALQSITRLNPGDTNGQSELERLDAKVLAVRLQRLGTMLSSSEPQQVVEAVEAIEAVGFKARPKGEIWSRAGMIRCQYLLAHAESIQTTARWVEVLGLVELIRGIESELKFQLPSPDSDRLRRLEQWAHGEREKDRRNREFSALLLELQGQIQRSEEKDTAARSVGLPELREDYESLHRTWRALQDHARPVPETPAGAFRKRVALLESEIVRRTTLRRRSLVAASAAAVVLMVVLVWFGMARMRGQEFTSQLQAAMAKRETRGVEALLERVRTSDKGLIGQGSVGAAVAAADSFLAKERSFRVNYETAFAKLPVRLEEDADGAAVGTVADALREAKSAYEVLAADLKAEAEPKVSAFERRWKQFLLQRGVEIDALLQGAIESAEAEATRLDFRSRPEAAREHLASLSKQLEGIDRFESGFTNHVKLRSDLIQRAVSIRAKYRSYKGELQKIDDGLAALAKAQSPSDHASAVNLIASSEFSGAPEVAAAASVRSVDSSSERVLRSILGVTNSATWAFIKSARSTDLFPEIRMPAELDMRRRLIEDPAVNASHYRYRLWLSLLNNLSEEWITAGSLLQSGTWSEVMAWTVSKDADAATFSRKDYGYFGGQWKLSPTVPIQRLETLPQTREASAFGEVGLQQVWEAGNAYGGPMLGVLDKLGTSRNGSPVFRAFLFCALVEFMEFQPDAWGLSFCPSAKAQVAQIRAIVGGSIRSGDWFLPSKSARWGTALEESMVQAGAFSFLEQAVANLALARAVSQDGLRYVGFAGLDGRPVITIAPPPATIIGHAVDGKSVVRLTGSAKPLSALFTTVLSPEDYLRNASLKSDSPSLLGALPPLFQTPTKP